ncbi:transcription initiation factor TFIID subunit 1-like [Rhagoletis pomonella]|uniref:transcription initiation factor TFIID subunit 1-like n=1 Tax=Rhagoletis pomonella TaxID=28610 RepID=UPI00177B8550|nr:transcription initiation factor TFIID subunit 1-like [Rhagoletis pomonella]
MDLDPNYDPSDFLNFGNRATSNNNTDDLQASQSKDDEQLPDGPMSGDMPSMPQMSLIMPGNDNVGIDEDLAISESDEEDDGGNATMKSEVFNDSGEMANDGMDTNMIAGSAVSQDNEVPMNVDTSKQEQHHQHDDNDDDDWLHF